MATEHPSVCTLDCPDTCSLSVTVEDDRIVKVRGSDVAALYRRRRSATRWLATAPSSFTARAVCTIRCGAVGPRGSGRFERISWAAGARQRSMRRVTSVIDRCGAAGGHAAELRAVRMACCRSTACRCASSTSSAQRSCSAARCAARCAARPGSALTATRPASAPRLAAEARAQCALGQQRHRHQPASGARRSARRSASGGRLAVIDPLRTQDRRAARTCTSPCKPSTDVLLGFALAVELERLRRP